MKKLKTKNFRYIKKREIGKPLHYLHLFYEQEIGIEDWRREVEILLMSGLDGRLRRVGFEYGVIGQRLMKQIEVAYAVYIHARIKERVCFHPHVATIPQMYNVLGQEHIYEPTEALLLFFEYQSLRDWIREIEQIVGDASLGFQDYFHGANDRSLLIYCRTMALINALYQIYVNNGMPIDLLHDSLKRT